MKCNFERLIEYLERRLNTDSELEILQHLERCEVCFDTICELVRERAAFRALRSRGQLQVAAMRRAGIDKTGPRRQEPLNTSKGSELSSNSGQILQVEGGNAAPRTCIRMGRRLTRWD